MPIGNHIMSPAHSIRMIVSARVSKAIASTLMGAAVSSCKSYGII